MTGAVKSLRATEAIEKLVNRYAVDEDPTLLSKFVRCFWNEEYEDDTIDCKQVVKQFKTVELQTLIEVIIKLLHSSATTKQFKDIAKEIEATRYIISQLLQEPSIVPSEEVLKQASEILGVAQLPEFYPIYTRPSEIFTIHTAWKYFTLLLQWKQEIYRFNHITDSTTEAKEVVKCDQLLASYISKHPNEFEEFIVQPEQLKALAELEDVKHSIENRAFGGVTEKVMSELAREESEESDRFLWRSWQAMNPMIAAQIPLYFGSGIHLVEMFVEKGGADVMSTIYSSKLVGQQFGDWVTAKQQRVALPDILPEDAVLATMTGEEINDKLYKYLFGLQAFEESSALKRQAQLNDYFYQNGIICEGEDIGQGILEDAQTLLQLNLEGGRHQMYRKVRAALDIGLYQHQMSLESYRQKLDDEDLKPLFERIRSEFKIESPQTEFPADFPLRVYFLGTMGHHQDALHPVAPMRSYYLEGDHVGGSADCLIVNLKQVSNPNEWTLEQMEMKLSERLNSSTPAAWEKETGVVYLSDMAPYLMRIACCFEGKNSRYRVDPKKLWSVIGDC